MNDFGEIATYLTQYEFQDDKDRFPLSYVSGWLEANLGELNGLTHEDFYIDASGNIGPNALEKVEKTIFSILYEIHYYEKATRDSLRGIVYSDSIDWISIKEGDTSIQRNNKNSVANTYKALAVDSRERLDFLLNQYNMQKSSPLQVYGTDGIPQIEAIDTYSITTSYRAF